jgi:hypothetical protein
MRIPQNPSTGRDAHIVLDILQILTGQFEYFPLLLLDLYCIQFRNLMVNTLQNLSILHRVDSLTARMFDLDKISCERW